MNERYICQRHKTETESLPLCHISPGLTISGILEQERETIYLRHRLRVYNSFFVNLNPN